MTIASYPYKDDIKAIFASMDEHWRINTIALYQGKQPDPMFYKSWLMQSTYSSSDIRRLIDDLCNDEQYRQLIMQKHNKEYGSNISWDFYISYGITGYYEAMPIGYRTWQCIMLIFIHKWYKEESQSKYPKYYPNNPLEKYYLSKGLILNIDYGLIDTTGFEVKYENGPKLYDRRLDTHIFVKSISPELLSYLEEERRKSYFKLALRPDYEICGDGIIDIMQANEGMARGDIQPIAIDRMPSLTWLYDDATSSDRLIILHNKSTCEITFEEFLADPDIENDYIISQVVHLRYTKVKGDFFINHLDHEYVFYTAEEHTLKMEDLRHKGTARPRYKTFKIDDAQIPYRDYSDKNILYRTLDAYFTNKDVLKEYFEAMINKGRMV